MSKIKYFHLYQTVKDVDGENHVVTVVGKLEQTRKPVEFTEDMQVEFKPNSFVNGELKYKRKILNRKLTIGLSICHPADDFDEEVGVEVAKSRIKHGINLGVLETSSVTMLTDDAIMAELFVKLEHVCNHIEEYLP